MEKKTEILEVPYEITNALEGIVSDVNELVDLLMLIQEDAKQAELILGIPSEAVH